MINAVVTLASSDGWKLIPPILYQEVAPETVFPKIKRPTNSSVLIEYPSDANCSKKIYCLLQG